MYMSIFSSFDALCAESFGLKKFDVAWAPSTEAKSEGAPSSAIREIPRKEKFGKSTGPPAGGDASSNQRLRQLRRKPRFAPELDGVHCFETIIPYWTG
ncbi:hypothetical protein NMG60_11020071 [Bertholletia excelsa]